MASINQTIAIKRLLMGSWFLANNRVMARGESSPKADKGVNRVAMHVLFAKIYCSIDWLKMGDI